MFGRKKIKNPHPYIKHTELGEPYLDVENFYKSDLAKKLEKRMEEIGNIVKRTSTHKDQKSKDESS